MSTDENSLKASPAAAFRGQNVVLLPCEPAQFRDFVSSLLGRPQTIERNISGPFEISKTDILNIHELIVQRLSSQNDATFMSFAAKIYYGDKSSVRLNSLQDFEVYGEVKPLVSERVSVSWIYLVKFPNKEIPEKQEIEIVFASGDMPSFISKLDFSAYSWGIVPGSIFLKISHTNRTWGSDLESLLSGQLATYVKPPSRLRAWISKHSDAIGMVVALVLTATAIFSCVAVINRAAQRYSSEAKGLLAHSTTRTDIISLKVDYLLSMIASGVWTRYGLYVAGFLVIMIAISITLGAYISASAEISKPSFVLLTAQAETERTKKLGAMENNWKKLASSIVVALIIAISGNYLFTLLNKFLPI